MTRQCDEPKSTLDESRLDCVCVRELCSAANNLNMGQSLNEVSLHSLGDFTKGTRKVLGSVAQQLHEMCLRLQ